MATSEAWKTVCMEIGGHWVAQSSFGGSAVKIGGGINVYGQVLVVVITSSGHLVRSEVWLGALRLRLVGVQ